MLKIAILGVLIGLSLAGCADSKGRQTPPPADVTQQDATDTSLCGGATPGDVNLFSRKWNSKTQFSNGAIVHKILTFTPDKVVFLARGEFKGRTSEIQVSSRFTELGANSITWEPAPEVSSTLNTDTQSFTYDLQLFRTQLTYTFAGSCLVLSADGDSLTLIPSR